MPFCLSFTVHDLPMTTQDFDRAHLTPVLKRSSSMLLDYCHDLQDMCLHDCSVHATSVLQMTHMLLRHGGVLKSGLLSKPQYMSSYWAAITHDYEHGGVNNDFLMKTAHPLAILYNDQSPLENHHCAAAAALLFQDQYQYIQVRSSEQG